MCVAGKALLEKRYGGGSEDAGASGNSKGALFFGAVKIETRVPSQKPGVTVQDKKQEKWPRLDFLFENGCVVHYSQYNDSQISHFPVNPSLPLLLLVFLYSWKVSCTVSTVLTVTKK